MMKIYVGSILISNSLMDLLFSISLFDSILLLRRRNLCDLNNLFWQCFDSCLQVSSVSMMEATLVKHFVDTIFGSSCKFLLCTRNLLELCSCILCVLSMHFTRILVLGLYFQHLLTLYFFANKSTRNKTFTLYSFNGKKSDPKFNTLRSAP